MSKILRGILSGIYVTGENERKRLHRGFDFTGR